MSFLQFSLLIKHLETEEELKVACRQEEQEETIHKLRVNLSERQAELPGFRKELEITNDELQNKVNWGLRKVYSLSQKVQVVAIYPADISTTVQRYLWKDIHFSKLQNKVSQTKKKGKILLIGYWLNKGY